MARDIMLTARITEAEEEFLKELGGGNRSQGLKVLLERAMVAAPARAQAPAPVGRAVHIPAGTPVKRFIGKR